MKELAKKKLQEEYEKGKYDKYASAMKKDVRDALLLFIEQDAEFAQAVAQGGSFEDCMHEVSKGCGSSISDLDAFRKAVQFYFKGADIQYHMTINLCAEAERAAGQCEDGAIETQKSKTIHLDLSSFL